MRYCSHPILKDVQPLVSWTLIRVAPTLMLNAYPRRGASFYRLQAVSIALVLVSCTEIYTAIDIMACTEHRSYSEAERLSPASNELLPLGGSAVF